MNSSTQEQAVWQQLLRLAKQGAQGKGAAWTSPGFDSNSEPLWKLYRSLCRPPAEGQSLSYSVAHLGQSLDGKIGPPGGEQEAITSSEDMTHNHRMRALFDVVLVGAGTVYYDNPQLTVRNVPGQNPVRVVVDRTRRLSADYRVFQDGEAPTLLLCNHDETSPEERHGNARVLGVRRDCHPSAILETLAAQELNRVFIEGGGVTVSRFVAAQALDVLQIAVSPLILGRGRPGVDLAETLRIRPRVERFSLGEDTLFQCELDTLASSLAPESETT